MYYLYIHEYLLINKLQKVSYYWTDHYGTSHTYAEINSKNILFMTIIQFSAYIFEKSNF